MQKEKWVDLMEFEGFYRISNKGTIRCIKRDKSRVVTQFLSDGYLQVRITRGWVGITIRIHTLVALHFVPNPDNKPTVNHIDENKENNWDKNLEWATHKEQMIHSFAKKVIQKTLEGKKVKVWESVRSTNEGGFEYKNVSACCLGKRKTHKNFIWEFV